MATDFVRCSRCVIPTTRPDTAFEDGVCSACRSYDAQLKIDWEARERELRELLDRHNGRCIVPSSGGKDSHWQVLTLQGMGADVTVVTATTCQLTPIGRLNIDNLARYARTIEVTPNRSVRAKLNRIALELVGDISWPEHVSIFTTPFRAAVALGIPLIFYGECPQTQYGGPPGTEHAKQMTARWRSEFGGFLGLRPTDLVGREGITMRDMQDYELPADVTGVSAHFLGQYVPWDSAWNARIARGAGMQWKLPTPANYWDAENLDNAQTGLHDHQMYRKYGYGRGCAQISVDVRAGRESRADALDWVRQYDGLFPTIYMGVTIKTVLDQIDMTMEKLDHLLDRFTNWALFDHEEDRRPILKEFV